ncbi:hypothetical protein [Streptosporangium sp. NPDC087985]|uniref:hypothetical protein n=1 Tax=Streptosporangium sp. NPDC087985 TaxID=3366196 RepID=UPI003824F267
MIGGEEKTEMHASLGARVGVLESDVAMVRAESVEHRAVSAAILTVLEDLRTVTAELRTTTDGLRKGQEELQATTDDLRKGQEELRATTDDLRKGQEELRAGQAELREDMALVKRSVGNLEVSVNDPLLREGA